MLQFISSLVVLAVISSGFSPSAADPDCSKRPEFDGIETCCSQQKPLVSDMGKACEMQTNQKGPGLDPCFAECLFNSSGILMNGEILWDKIKPLISETLKDTPDFIPIMEASLIKCEQLVKSKAASLNGSSDPGKCSKLPVILTKCMMVSSFVNCPESGWKNDEKCNNAKEYFKSCPMSPVAPK